MGSRTTRAVLDQQPTDVPVNEDRQVTVRPGDPWPSAYRGSEYSIVASRKHGAVAEWSHMGNIQAVTDVPDGLQDALRNLGKDAGLGSFRLTAAGEVLTKIPASDYRKREDAPVSRGHVPVYVGKIDGTFDFQAFSNDPTPPESIGNVSVWSGLPFKHGETWAVTSDDTLCWSWQDYYFESAFDHPEIAETYKRFRPGGGLIYINEHGHIWGNVNREDVPASERELIGKAYSEWERTASNAEQRLVTRRLERMKSESAPDGLLPVYFGHLSQFDDGLIPKPIVDDEYYFTDEAKDLD